MKCTRPIVAVSLLAATLFTVSQGPAHAAGGGRLTSAGSVTLSALVSVDGADTLGSPELPQGERQEGASPAAGAGKKVDGARVTTPGPELTLTFPGLNHRDQRLSNGGNQFSSEPPDQALCVGPNHVLEAVNSAMRVYTKSGAPATGTVSLNQFFGYPPSIDRTTGTFGAFLTDPTCHFDADTGRYFLVVLTLDQSPEGVFTGKNRLDLAVSNSDDPTGSWNLYKLAVQNDGTEGTPNHGCDSDPAPPTGRTNPAACIGDYPHIGADAYGIYLTTNEYSFFSDGSNGGAGYTGSQIYVYSKSQLVAADPSPTIVAFESPALGPFRSFTVWPAISPAGQFALANGGTEYFLSSTLGDGSETGNRAPHEKRIGVWSLTNTSSIDTPTPAITLQNRLIQADTYALPPQATQKDGPAPLRDCLNDTSDLLGPGLGCWALFSDAPPAVPEVLSNLDSGDTRMQQVVYANGQIWGALSTAVRVEGASGTTTRAGALWVAVTPTMKNGKLKAETQRSGYIAVGDNDVTYPALGVGSSGAVVIAATLTGNDHYPSAAYSIISNGRPRVKVISEGVGPQDGFTGYPSIGGGRPRWGDYGAIAMDGGTLWLASESIEQSCTLDQYLAAPLGSCGGTRTAYANWGTRVTALHI